VYSLHVHEAEKANAELWHASRTALQGLALWNLYRCHLHRIVNESFISILDKKISPVDRGKSPVISKRNRIVVESQYKWIRVFTFQYLPHYILNYCPLCLFLWLTADRRIRIINTHVLNNVNLIYEDCSLLGRDPM
jgi:hypothetical protein